MGLNCYQCLSAVDEYCKRTSTVKQLEATPCDSKFCAVRMFTVILVYIYRPSTKWREGNVFGRVCPSVSHSVHGGSYVTTTHDALDLTTQEPLRVCPTQPNPLPTQTWGSTMQGPPGNDIWWPRLEICSNLFT